MHRLSVAGWFRPEKSVSMKRIAIASLALCALLLSCGQRGTGAKAASKAYTPAAQPSALLFKDFTVVQDPANPESSTVKFSDYVGRGKYVLVDFWASWCGPCRAETPYLKAVYDKYKGDRFDVLSIAISDDPADSRAAAKELGISWSQIVNAQQIPAELYDIQYIPLIILFGPDGQILARNIRGEQIEKAVAEALAQ